MSTTVRPGEWVPLEIAAVPQADETVEQLTVRLNEEMRQRFPGYLFGHFPSKGLFGALQRRDGHVRYTVNVLREWSRR